MATFQPSLSPNPSGVMAQQLDHSPVWSCPISVCSRTKCICVYAAVPKKSYTLSIGRSTHGSGHLVALIWVLLLPHMWPLEGTDPCIGNTSSLNGNPTAIKRHSEVYYVWNWDDCHITLGMNPQDVAYLRQTHTHVPTQPSSCIIYRFESSVKINLMLVQTL